MRSRLQPAPRCVTAGAVALSVATLVPPAVAAPVRQPTLTGRAVLPALQRTACRRHRRHGAVDRGPHAPPEPGGPLIDDTDQRRRFVHAFDVVTGAFRPRVASLRLAAAGDAIGDLSAAGRDSLLSIDRDHAQGRAARFTRVLLVDTTRFNGDLPLRPLVDLLRLANPDLVGGREDAPAVGLGDPFAFPFQTIESVLVQDPRTLLVANDDNVAFSSGRRPGVPDEDELVAVRPPAPLPVGQ